MTCYIFNQSPETHKSWTLAVFAVDKKDAYEYIKATHPGMRMAGEITSGKVDANCGAVTDRQMAINRAKLESLIS
jgi:hypothetical protein